MIEQLENIKCQTLWYAFLDTEKSYYWKWGIQKYPPIKDFLYSLYFKRKRWKIVWDLEGQVVRTWRDLTQAAENFRNVWVVKPRGDANSGKGRDAGTWATCGEGKGGWHWGSRDSLAVTKSSLTWHHKIEHQDLHLRTHIFKASNKYYLLTSLKKITIYDAMLQYLNVSNFS